MNTTLILLIYGACATTCSFALNVPADTTTPAANPAPATGVSKLGSQLKPGLGLTNGKWGKKMPNTKAEYYIVYYSASWCGPCVALAPHSVEGYNKHIAGQNRVELIAVSSDQSTESAKTWAEKENMPWVIYPEINAPEFAKKHDPPRIPRMKLIGPDGELIAEGRDISQLMDKIPSK